jgi:flagellar motor protein MotB
MIARAFRKLLPLVLVIAPGWPSAAEVTERPVGESAERHMSDYQPHSLWMLDEGRFADQQGDMLEVLNVLEDRPETVKLRGVVPPIRFASGVANIPDETVAELSRILNEMQHRRNVRLHLVGHADDQPLSPRLASVYGDNAGLSRERAGQVAEYFQTQLALAPEAISYEWAGDTDPVASNLTAKGRSLNRRVEVEVWYDELREGMRQEEVLVENEIQRVKVCRMETVCKLRYAEGNAHRARLQNLVPPLYYTEEAVEISPQFIAQIKQAFDNLQDKQNVMVKFVGFTDDQRLNGRIERIYGDHLGFSKAKARRVALSVQEQLELPTAAVASDGRGSARPIGSNMTAQGRALNRRVEVEFWYDDPLQQLPDEPQLCPESPGAELVTKVYDPPWGALPDIEFADGQPEIPSGYTEKLSRALADVADKQNARVRFIGFTRNERISRRTAMVYTDDIGLSAARARRVMEAVATKLELPPEATEFEGRGFVHAFDVVNAGFTQVDESYVTAQIVYDDLAVLDNYEDVEVTRLTRELSPQNALGLNMMRITVDGVPTADPQRSSADIQRCTDVAMEDAEIAFKFDNLRAGPRLNVRAEPPALKIPVATDTATASPARPVRFRMYTNYGAYIERAEVRLFEEGESTRAEPLAVLPISAESLAEWTPETAMYPPVKRELQYVLRVYGRDGNFDETRPQPLWLIRGQAGEAAYVAATDTLNAPDESQPEQDANIDAPSAEEAFDDSGEEEDGDQLADADDESLPPVSPGAVGADPLLPIWGENNLAVQNIDIRSGTMGVSGSGIPDDHSVWVAGREIPVSDDGEFITEEVLPQGAHTVEVAVLDEEGQGELYLRDFEFESNDWFYVGMADVTISENSGSGPFDELSGDDPLRDPDSSADGRLAFFVDGKFSNDWRLRASADTREDSIDDLFSNFMDKSPESLFRRIDPDYYYPTFGDDSTVEELAPTSGKFYVELTDEENYAKWGNFEIGYLDNELAQVDRGLYGANVYFQSPETTSFGERQFRFDAFAAEPGTVGSRDEFRGTGGSLYFLNRQDILTGSERVRIEIRDKASGITKGVVNLSPSVDYDIDYIQGRVTLAEPLSATATDNLLVRNNSTPGDEAFLVVRYEYTPGFEELDDVALGGQANYWFGDYLRLGITSSSIEEDSEDNTLLGADATLRMNTATWLKLQAARSEGLVSSSQLSNDGGFDFLSADPLTFVDADAGAYRADVSLNSNDVIKWGDSQLNLYVQDREAGFSAPGQSALRDTANYGGTLDMPVTEKLSLYAQVDKLDETDGLQTQTQEYNLMYEFNQRWELSTGVRIDDRSDDSPVVPLTQNEGERSDGIVQLGYKSDSNWDAYGFAQETLDTSGDREDNGRVGLGGTYQPFERLSLQGELSGGDLGTGGKIGANYLHSERTSYYANYALENERTDNANPGYQGRQGNLVAGVKSRFTDSASVFMEERYQHSDNTTGLIHAGGLSLAPTERINVGLTLDVGTLEDRQTGAETDRRAGGVQFGYGFENLKLFSGVEYRNDETEQPDLSKADRKTWLFRNNLTWQITEGARLLGKLNHSDSDSSLGDFYNGGFTEAVLGYAYRPVAHDRLNTLVKYTYFYNMPTTDQVSVNNTAAEYIQKSHIAALDVTYDLTRSFSVGGKYAYRLGELSYDRVDEEFFDNKASLYVLRADYNFRDKWEFLLEGRLLDLPDLGDQRTGTLFTVSRYVGKNLKLGVGYSFADFSDDLTDLDYDHKGFFVNLVGVL